MSNFAFLQSEWSLLHQDAVKAESFAHSDPRTACIYARRTLELSVNWLYKHDQSLKLPYQDNLSALLYAPSFQQAIGPALCKKVELIKKLGNQAAHSHAKIMPADALAATRELFHFCYWVARTYGQKSRPDPGLQFSAALLPPAASGPTAIPQKTLDQLKALEIQLRERDEKLSELLTGKAALDLELAAARAQISAAKAANAALPDTHDYSEAQTRDYFIDLLLKEAGWSLDQRNLEVPVQGMPSASGQGKIDYVLWADDGKPLALIEAKRTRRSPQDGQQQAKLYADCLQTMTGQRPVIFYTNGYDHWLWDDASHPPRPVQGFFKKDELELMIQRRTSRKTLADAVINTAIIERYYQSRAVRRISDAFETDRQRRALVVMATGAGKTRTAIALVDLLTRCNWAKRVLFLADRLALVDQAVKEFGKHLPDASPVNLARKSGKQDAKGRVFGSTYQTMMGLIDGGGDGPRQFGPGHFDLIIIDEAHRSVYQKYGAIFGYFDALLVGLTATPQEELDRNTYRLFQLEDGVPTDAYGLDEAINDGYLVRPESISVPLKIQRDGLKYADLNEDEKDRWDALEWNDDGVIPAAVDAPAVNQWFFNEDTVDKVLAHLMARGQKVAGGDRLGKTIIFAKNNDHADFIAKRFNLNYPQHHGAFARVITYRTDYADTLIEDFKRKDKAPHIAISVDMLDTGIDVPEILNLVFFKVVRSKTKFWQMLGRGTRLCPNLFAPGRHKGFFYIFDFCQNLEFFSQNLPQSEGAMAASLSTRLFKARLAIIAGLDTLLAASPLNLPSNLSVNQLLTVYGEHPNEPQLRAELAESMRIGVAAMNLNSFVVRPQRKSVEKFARAEAWHRLGPDDFDELRSDLASLPTGVVDEDEEAKRFDLLVLHAQLAVLQARSDLGGLREKIQAIAQTLALQDAIPAINAQMVLIQEVASDDWWQGVTLPLLELARKRLRALIKLIEKGQKNVVYTDFEDELGEETTIDLPHVGAAMDLAKFKDKARQFLRAHDSHVSLQRLRRNQALTPSDLNELERMLLEAGGSPQLIGEAAAQSDGLGIFIRSLVGLERDAAKDALNQFIQGAAVSANQIEFIDLVVDYLTENGVMALGRLYESPFTDINPQGPEGVFPLAAVDQLAQVLTQIRLRAAA
jgi:type I restriction enzyme R subunit